MPASVRWLVLLVATCIVGALASGVGMYLGANHRTRDFAEETARGEVKAGKQAVDRYGCHSCHTIGFTGPAGQVGPALAGVATRAHIAGVLPNTPDAMVRWLQHPQQVLPGNGMPELGVTERDAHDMAAYLYTLK